jgi:isopentenyl phosphate kinase
MSELMILKVGGSVITDKHSEQPKVDFSNLNRLADEIAKARPERLIFMHGAGSYGHVIVKKSGIGQGIRNREQILAFAETQRLQNELDSIVCKALIERGVPAIPCQASSTAVMDKGRLVKMDTDAIAGMLETGLVPVLYGVPAYDRDQKCSILSADQIAPYLALKLGAKKIIHGTNVDGVFTGDPNKNPDAKLIPEITSKNFDQVRQWLTGSNAVDVTGGMFGKVYECMEAAKNGVESLLVNAIKKNYVRKALAGEKVVGTVIKA